MKRNNVDKSKIRGIMASENHIPINKNVQLLCNINFLSQLQADQVNKKVVALSSFPGSGNTFTRLLLEKSLGIYTGSIYNDRSLKVELPGEGGYSNVLLVKTHFPCLLCWKNKDGTWKTRNDQKRLRLNIVQATVLVVRNPFKAFLAEFQRQAAGGLSNMEAHTASILWSKYIGTREFQIKFEEFIDGWILHTNDRLNKKEYGNNIKMFYFEDLVGPNTTATVLSIAHFIEQSYATDFGELPWMRSLLDDKRVTSCVDSHDDRVEKFHRKKVFNNLPVLTKNDIIRACEKLGILWNSIKWGKCEDMNPKV